VAPDAVHRLSDLQLAGILLDNAVKYTPEGGRVRVREGGGQVVLEVSDTSIGIADAQLPLLDGDKQPLYTALY
jgi:signal transduction histidine kinase